MNENKLKSITIPRLNNQSESLQLKPLLMLSDPEYFEKKEIIIPILKIKPNFDELNKSNLTPEEIKIQEEYKELEKVRTTFENQYKSTMHLIDLQKQDIFNREQQLQFKVAAANMQLRTYCDKYNEEKRKLKQELLIIKSENQKLKEDNEKYLQMINKNGLLNNNSMSNISNSNNISIGNHTFRINHSSKNLPNVSLNGKKIDFNEQQWTMKHDLKSSLSEDKELSPPTKQKAEIESSSLSSTKSQPMFDIQRPPKPSEIKALVIGPKIEQKQKSNTQENSTNNSSLSHSNSSRKHKKTKAKEIQSPQILDDSNSSVFDEFD